MGSLLELCHILHHYNGRPVLEVPALKIETGTIVGLVGPNGSGKTTLLKLIACVEKSSAGTIHFQGEQVEPFSRRVRFRICLLTQEPYLLKRSVFDNIAYGLKLRGGEENLRQAVADALELVGLPISFADRQWHELSGGEAQRVALAARLALKPVCLLLDEPTASVDMRSAEKIRQAILMARRVWGTTVIVASHHRSWLGEVCDYFVFLFNGRLLDHGIENIVFGPWERLNGKRYGKRLADGQLIIMPAPAHGESSAIIVPQAIRINRDNKTVEEENKLRGVITGVFLERHSGEMRLQVSCGDHCFMVSSSREQLNKGSFLPGQAVTLKFHVQDVIWLPS